MILRQSSSSFQLIFILISVSTSKAGPKNQCYMGLGLENGQIPDDHITASENTSSAFHGRLNNPSDAWCFSYESIYSEKVTFTVDLGKLHLVSGFQSQGPPTAKHPSEYLRYVGLEVKFSPDGEKWLDCCDNQKMAFYADDKSDSSDIIANHSFHTLVSARFIQIVASTDVRWIGHADKCFRFEILGCGSDEIVPEVGFIANPLPAGFLETRWSMPSVFISKKEKVTLPSPFFHINVTHTENNETFVNMFNVSDTSLILNSPMWGSSYYFAAFCHHPNLGLLNCGSWIVDAVVVATPECFEHTPLCRLPDRVIFVSPQTLSSESQPDGSVSVRWVDSKLGWRSPLRQVKVLDGDGGVELATSHSRLNQNILHIPKLSIGLYKLLLSPDGNSIPSNTPTFTAVLAILPIDGNHTQPMHQSFIASVNLRTFILWSGGIRATWDQAMASSVSEINNTVHSTLADEYTVTLKQIGDDDILEKFSLDGNILSHNFSGIEAAAEYEVNLTCTFGDRHFQCGYSTIFSNSPTLVDEVLNGTSTMYVETHVPSTWHNLENMCQASGGHLVSLDSNLIESELATRSTLSDFWCGGNMCTNSPAPAHSMWSDGSAQSNTNFDSDSGLDGTHCCIKVESDPGNQTSKWKGEKCSTILHGICEFKITEYIDAPMNGFGRGTSPTNINITWTTEGLFWQPTEYAVEYCYSKSMSGAALPHLGPLCQSVTVEGSRGEQTTNLSYLEPYSEYNVTVTGKINPFKRSRSHQFIARTLPKNDVDWVITNDGILKMSWLKKIADFQELDPVQLDFQVEDVNDSGQAEGTVQETELKNLRFGKVYNVFLTDKNLNETHGPFIIEAYPNCTIGDRYDLECNYISDQQFDHHEAMLECFQKGIEVKTLNESELQEIPWEDYPNTTMVWIPTEDVTNESSRTFQNDSKSSDLCRAWSVSLEAFHSIPCSTNLSVLCHYDLPISMHSPNKSELRILTGPDYIYLDWPVSNSSWASEFSVEIESTNVTLDFVPLDGDNDSDSASPKQMLEIFHSSIFPPINISDLSPENQYKVVITTSLNDKLKTKLTLEDVFTTANNSKMPEEIIGYTMSKDDYKAAELSTVSILMVLLTAAIVVFVISGTLPLYPDNAVQVCFEISLLSCHIFLLLAILDGPMGWNPKDQTLCIIAVTFLCYFSLASFVFLFLESLCIAHRLVGVIFCGWTDKIGILVISGFGFPMMYTSIAVAATYKDLIPSKLRVCWLNLDDATSAVCIVPNCILFVLTIIFLLVSIFGTTRESTISDANSNRKETLKMTRFVQVLITFLAALGWSLGITSAHYQREELIILFLVVNLLLGIAILGLRCFLDKQVCFRLKRYAMSNRDLEQQYQATRAVSAIGAGTIASVLSKRRAQVHVAPETERQITPVGSEPRSSSSHRRSPTQERPRNVRFNR